MTLKRLNPVLFAALAIFACTPGATLDDGATPQKQEEGQEGQEGQEQTDETTVVVDEAGNITSSGASLYGEYSRAISTPEEKGFEWGTSETDLTGKVQSESVVSGRAGMFSATLDGLSPDTVYYFRAYITVQGKSYRSEVASFRTEASEGGGEGGEGGEGGDLDNIPQPGWFELPEMNIAKDGKYMINASDNSQYYAWHICPDVYGPVAGRLARNYTVCYDSEKHCPLWVAAPRHDMYSVKNTDRSSYGQDPDIPSGVQYSSTDTGGDCNKGHMLGSAERRVSAKTNKQVFYYSNIAPQLSSNFNNGGGRWNVLEDWVDKLVCADTLYETIGCYFEPYTDAYGQSATPATISFGGRNDVVRPTMFYYVLLRTKSGNSKKALSQCNQEELQCVAFVRAHVNVRQAVKATELMSVSDLEKITGVSYFANVPQAPKDTFNASDWGL